MCVVGGTVISGAISIAWHVFDVIDSVQLQRRRRLGCFLQMHAWWVWLRRFALLCCCVLPVQGVCWLRHKQYRCGRRMQHLSPALSD